MDRQHVADLQITSSVSRSSTDGGHTEFVSPGPRELAVSRDLPIMASADGACNCRA